jgi:cyclopropane fatty-acyl-phospholipid synthase-like methyltransferase
VCATPTLAPFQTIGPWSYLRCGECAATMLAAHQLPDEDTQRRHYMKHENDLDDPRYRAFLRRLAEPLLARLKPGLSGLDYGCGPGPLLARMLAQAGHSMRVYDPFFAPDAQALQQRYDFVTCTEVAEHFHRPRQEFERLRGLLKPGGVLALMTCLQTEDRLFANWHYRRDPTHVVFYREETFRWIARALDLHFESPARNVIFLGQDSRGAVPSPPSMP